MMDEEEKEQGVLLQNQSAAIEAEFVRFEQELADGMPAFRCTMSGKKMLHPTMSADGKAYEKEAFFNGNPAEDDVTNFALKNAIQACTPSQHLKIALAATKEAVFETWQTYTQQQEALYVALQTQQAAVLQCAPYDADRKKEQKALVRIVSQCVHAMEEVLHKSPLSFGANTAMHLVAKLLSSLIAGPDAYAHMLKKPPKKSKKSALHPLLSQAIAQHVQTHPDIWRVRGDLHFSKKIQVALENNTFASFAQSYAEEAEMLSVAVKDEQGNKAWLDFLSPYFSRIKQEIPAGDEKEEGGLEEVNGFVCPLSNDIFTDPMMTEDGHTYERAAIQQWFKYNATSPNTNAPLASTILVENKALKKAIADYFPYQQRLLKMLSDMQSNISAAFQEKEKKIATLTAQYAFQTQRIEMHLEEKKYTEAMQARIKKALSELETKIEETAKKRASIQEATLTEEEWNGLIQSLAHKLKMLIPGLIESMMKGHNAYDTLLKGIKQMSPAFSECVAKHVTQHPELWLLRAHTYHTFAETLKNSLQQQAQALADASTPAAHDEKESEPMLAAETQLTPEAAIDLVHARLPETSTTDIDALLDATACFSLALSYALAYLLHTGCSVQIYLEKYTEQYNRTRSEKGEDLRPVRTAFLLNYHAIQHDALAVRILTTCSYLAPEAISLEMFLQAASAAESCIPSTGEASVPSMRNSLALLKQYALLQQGASASTLRMHPLSQEIVRNTAVWDEPVPVLDSVADFIMGTDAYCPLIEHVAHLEEIVKHHVQAHFESKTLAKINAFLGMHYVQQENQRQKSNAFFTHALSLFEKQVGPHCPEMIVSLHGLVSLHRSAQDLAAEHTCLIQLSTIYEKLYAELANKLKKYAPETKVAQDLQDTARDMLDTFIELATVCRKLNQREEGQKHLHTALTYTIKLYGLQHPKGVVLLRKLAEKEGDPAKRAKYLAQAQEIEIALLDASRVENALERVKNIQPGTALVMVQANLEKLTQVRTAKKHRKQDAHIATTLVELSQNPALQKEYTKQRALLQYALDLQKKCLPPEDPPLALTLAYFAAAYRNPKGAEEALHNARTSYRILKSDPAYDPQHPHTQRCLKILSDAGWSIAQLEKGGVVSQSQQRDAAALNNYPGSFHRTQQSGEKKEIKNVTQEMKRKV